MQTSTSHFGALSTNIKTIYGNEVVEPKVGKASKFTSRYYSTNLIHTLANHRTQTTKVHTTKINQARTIC